MLLASETNGLKQVLPQVQVFEERQREQCEYTSEDVVVDLGAYVVRLQLGILTPSDVDLHVQTEHGRVELPVNVPQSRVTTHHVNAVSVDCMLYDVAESPHLASLLTLDRNYSRTRLDFLALSIDQSHDTAFRLFVCPLISGSLKVLSLTCLPETRTQVYAVQAHPHTMNGSVRIVKQYSAMIASQMRFMGAPNDS